MIQKRDDLPYFPLYACNILCNKQYRLMSHLERSLWISIYMECWPNGSVPSDTAELSKYLGFSIEETKSGLTDRVLSFFKVENGSIFSPQLEKYWKETIAKRTKQSSGGKKGMKARYSKGSGVVSQLISQPITSLSQIKSSSVKLNYVDSSVPINIVKTSVPYNKYITSNVVNTTKGETENCERPMNGNSIIGSGVWND